MGWETFTNDIAETDWTVDVFDDVEVEWGTSDFCFGFLVPLVTAPTAIAQIFVLDWRIILMLMTPDVNGWWVMPAWIYPATKQ